MNSEKRERERRRTEERISEEKKNKGLNSGKKKDELKTE